MTKEKATSIIKTIRRKISLPKKFPSYTLGWLETWIHTEDVEAFDMAIESLEQESNMEQFAKWVATEIFDDNWEYNKNSFEEIACRKLAKLGIVRANGDEWELVDPQESEKTTTQHKRIKKTYEKEDYEKYINALRKCAKEHENDKTFFSHIIVSDLCRDTANLLETLEQEQKAHSDSDDEALDKILETSHKAESVLKE